MDAYLTGLERRARRRHRPRRRSSRSRRSSCRASTPRSTSGSRRSARTRRWRCAARPRWPTPGSPTPRSRRSSTPTAGAGARGSRRQPAAPAVGVHRREEPGLPRHPLRHATWSSPTPSTRCRRRRSRRSPTTARSQGDQVTGRAADAQAGLRPARRRSGSTSTTCSLVLETEGVDKFKKSWDELVETVQGQMDSRRISDGSGVTDARGRLGDLAAAFAPGPARLVRRRPRPRRPPDLRGGRPHRRPLQGPRRRRGPGRPARPRRRSRASPSGGTRCSAASTSTSPRTARCCTPRCASPRRHPRGRRPGRRRRRARGPRARLRVRRAGPLGRLDRRHRRADPDRRQHRHRRLRPRPGDGLRGARALPPGRPRVPVHQQHRPDRRRQKPQGPRPGDDALHRRQQDVRHARDAHQRPAVQGLAARRAVRRGPRRRRSPSTSSPCPPRSTRSRTSASTRPTRSASGTGSAGATR